MDVSKSKSGVPDDIATVHGSQEKPSEVQDELNLNSGRVNSPVVTVPVPEAPRSVSVTPNQPQNITVVIGRHPAHKSLCEAYILCMPLGIIGLHHFYLRRYGFGFLYFFTLGLCGVGWFVDIFRMPLLVKKANKKIDNPGQFEPLTKTDAYILWFPLGILGFHHYYLRRPAWGIAYTFTIGFFGIGWLLDCFRIPSLVQEANDRLQRERMERRPRDAQLRDAYVLGVSPAGIFGCHHFYLGNFAFGLFYFFTLGVAGIGWIVDWFRMKQLVERSNHPDRHMLGKRHKHLDDAYVMAFPFGLVGAHHFYLERPGWGALYFFTLGLAGVGWLVDLVRMSSLVKQTNKRLEDEMRMVAEIQAQLGSAICTVTQTNVSIHPSGTNGFVVLPDTNEYPTNQAPPPPYSAGPNFNTAPMGSGPLPPAYSNEGYDGQKI